jgi:hypothetical protein
MEEKRKAKAKLGLNEFVPHDCQWEMVKEMVKEMVREMMG